MDCLKNWALSNLYESLLRLHFYCKSHLFNSMLKSFEMTYPFRSRRLIIALPVFADEVNQRKVRYYTSHALVLLCAVWKLLSCMIGIHDTSRSPHFIMVVYIRWTWNTLVPIISWYEKELQSLFISFLTSFAKRKCMIGKAEESYEKLGAA